MFVFVCVRVCMCVCVCECVRVCARYNAYGCVYFYLVRTSKLAFQRSVGKLADRGATGELKINMHHLDI